MILSRITTLTTIFAFTFPPLSIAATPSQSSSTQPIVVEESNGTGLANSFNLEINLDAKSALTTGQLLSLLQQKVPSFQYVIQEQGPWQDFVLPRLQLRNVTVEQLLELIRSFDPQFQFGMIGGGYSIYLIGNGKHARPQGPQTTLMSVGLSDTVDRLALRKAWAITPAGDESASTPQQVAVLRKEALKEILSLLQAAIAQSAEQGIEPSIKLHEETEVLLVRGTPLQLSAVSDALNALKNADDPKRYESKYNQILSDYINTRSETQNLKRQTNMLQKQRDDSMQQVSRLSGEVRALKAQLDASQGKKDAEQKH